MIDFNRWMIFNKCRYKFEGHVSDERCNYQRQQYMDKVKKFVGRNKYWLFVMPAIVSVATSGLYFEHYYFIGLYVENGPSSILLETSNIGLYIMCFISFAQCIRIKNSLPPQLAPPRIKSQLRNNHPLYVQKNICEKDSSRYKPARTSHCHICGCVTRMDHHCAYINNCVGLRNFKAFLLFTGYGGIFALQFLILSISTYFKMIDQQSNKFTEDQTTAWVLLTICSFILTLSMLGLTISNLLMALKNITRMDLLKGTFRFNDTEGDHPNPFDLGRLSNFNSIFQKQAWLFWFPTAVTHPNDGTQFPMIPPIYNEDINTLFDNIREMIKDPIERSIPNSIEELREKEIDNYKDVIFFFMGKEYRLNHDKKQKIIVPNVEMEAAKEESDKSLDSSTVNILSE